MKTRGDVRVYDVVIIGGGPAGSAVAISLARAGGSVLILEAKPIPHDTLCGEFLSPECQSLLAQLGVAEKILALHPATIRAARLVADDGTRWAAPFSGAAWGLSRLALDFALINAACAGGAVVHDNEAGVRVSGDLKRGFEIATRCIRTDVHETYHARVIISAHGKRSVMDRALGRAFLGKVYPLFGMKRHFRGPPPPDGVALHGFAGGYCGLGAIEGGAVNVCFLADDKICRRIDSLPKRQRVAGTVDVRAERLLAYMAAANAILGTWLREAEPMGQPWQSVGALAFGPRGVVQNDVLMVGDAAGLIAPLAGDGIGMALRSGQLCATHVQRFLCAQQTRHQLVTNYIRAWNAEFLPRLRLAGALQTMALRPALLRATLRLFQRAPALGHWIVKHTRG